MGDRQTFQVMPSGSATPSVSRTARALEFSHDDENAKQMFAGLGPEETERRFTRTEAKLSMALIPTWTRWSRPLFRRGA